MSEGGVTTQCSDPVMSPEHVGRVVVHIVIRYQPDCPEWYLPDSVSAGVQFPYKTRRIGGRGAGRRVEGILSMALIGFHFSIFCTIFLLPPIYFIFRKLISLMVFMV